MINWPSSLIKDIARRNCVLYLGSGVSHNSQNANGEHPMTWLEFLKNSINNPNLSTKQKREISNKIKVSDYLMACELFRRYVGRDVFNDIVKDAFQKPRYKEADIHHQIFKLDSRIVVTPNFDRIYDTYSSSESKSTIVIKHYYDTDIANFIRDSDRIILKIHGCISKPDKMIFSQVDYAKARNDHSDFYQILNALIITQTFVFLGAGLNDPDIRLLLENYSFQYKWSRKHFFVIPKNQLSETERKIYEDSLNISFILYNPSDNHKELTDSLKELVEKVEAKRTEIAESQDW
ncbi:MAG: SIR2 family protein [Bacteroidales bacterium]|nr:SIR2 family protein [Bacteroidales bacterium]